MTTYTSYAQAKIAHPDSEIVTTGKNWVSSKRCVGTFEELDGHKIIGDNARVICNPADYCSTLKEFLEAGFKLVAGDKYYNSRAGMVATIVSGELGCINKLSSGDERRYILSAAALNGGCKIPSKVKDFCNTDVVKMESEPLSLCENDVAHLQFIYHRLVNIHGEHSGYDYMLRLAETAGVKPKSERELFINKCTDVMRKAGTKCPDNHEYFGVIFDAGARYVDETQHFGEDYK